MPAKLREELGESFMIAPALRGNCIKAYSLEEWQAYIEPIRDIARKTNEHTYRYLHSKAAQVSPDSQGRVLLTPELIKKAMLEKDVVIVGCGYYVEIWSKDEYEKTMNEMDFDAVVEELEKMGL